MYTVFRTRTAPPRHLLPPLRVGEGCCLDFTHPCDVPPFPNTPSTKGGKRSLWPTWFKTDATRDKHDKGHKWTKEYGKGGLFWSYGGAGTFLSAGLLEKVHQGMPQEMPQDIEQGRQGGGNSSSDTEGGWERCTEMFGIGYDTDIQLGMCLRAHGLSTSTYQEGFDRDCETADPDEIGDRLAANCQVLGIHLGIRHFLNDEVYTAEAFRDAADAVHREDVKWASPTNHYMLQTCPKALESFWEWEL